MLIWLLFAVSSVLNFRPDTGGRRWTLIQVASSITLRGETGAVFPSAAQTPAWSIWSVPCAAQGSSPPVFHKSADLAAPAVCAFPTQAAQAARSLTGALSLGVARLFPSVVPASVSASASRVRVCAFSPPRPQPQSPPAQVGCQRPVSRRDPPSGCRPSRLSGGL